MEVWRDIPGFEGYYQASNMGRIKSLSRQIFISKSNRSIGYYRRVNERFLKPGLTSNGYFSCTLWVEHESHQQTIHSLVLESFSGLRPDGLYGCHKDDDKTNNRLENLYWGTPKENSGDKIINGNQPYGEKCQSSKLIAADVINIRQMAKTKTAKELSEKYGVLQPQIWRIIHRKQWRHIP